MPEPNDDNKPNPAEAFQRLLDKYNNDGVKLAAQLFDENFTYRNQIRELTGKQPADGAKVLSPDDAKKYQAFVDLGVDAKELKKALDRLPELEKQNKELSQMETLRELADIGIDGSRLKLSVLKDQLTKYPDAVLSFRTEKDADGKEAKVAYIKDKPDGSERSFTEFANENLADYLPALKVNAEANTPPPPGNGPDPKPTGHSASLFDRIRSSAKDAPQAKTRSIDEAFGRAA